MKTVFLRALEADDKAAALRAAIAQPELARGKQRFEVDPMSFASMPRSPFAYWVSERLRGLFTELSALGEVLLVTSGTGTLDDFRFLRVWWEVDSDSQLSDARRWPVYAKGGSYSPFYFDHYLNVNWASDGAEMKAWIVSRYGGGHWARNIRSTEHYFRPGLTWPRRTQGGLSLRAMPADCIFADKGPAAFTENDDSNSLLAHLAVMNSKTFRALVDLQMAFGSYEVGVIQRTPVPDLSMEEESSLATRGRRVWSLKRSFDTRTETSHAFTLPALLQVEGDTLGARAVSWAERVRKIDADLAVIQADIDERCFGLYDIDQVDRSTITEGFGGTLDAGGDLTDEEAETDDEDETQTSADAAGLAAELMSWAVGAAFGRFDVRLATGTRALPPEPSAFEPLPVCSPAMLVGDKGQPLDRAPAGYPLTLFETGILVDDPGHPRDLTAAVRAVFDVVFGTDADAWWSDVAALLDSRAHDLRAWLASRFFEHHLARHSKSRRKAPILWHLGTPSGRYGVWLYAHRLTHDSFFQVQSDIVGPKLAHEERQLTNLTQNGGGDPSAKEREEIAAHETLVEELRALVDEVKRVTPLWNPTLDDGVALTMAPLWRLVPQHKSWQKELKSKWDELAAGKHDWARVAMHLWPERVVPKCATDRSLAIAHGLEEAFWVEGADGKWKARATPARPTDELLRDRTSANVKAALRSLLEASSVSAGNGRGPRRRAVAAASYGGTRR